MNSKIAVLASGNGSNFEALCDAAKEGKLSGDIVLLVCNKQEAYCLERASRLDIPAIVLSPSDYSNQEEWDRALCTELVKRDIDYIVLAGFLRKIGSSVVENFSGKIINTHPSLLPKYGGKGMYGAKVHEAVFGAQEKESGVTIHLVNSNYDEGQIIAQRSVSIEDCNSAVEVEEKVKSLETPFLIQVVSDYIKTNN